MDKNKLEYNHIKMGTFKIEKSIYNNDEYSRTTIYNRSGNIREIKNYKNDNLNGEIQTYWPNGKPHLQGEYMDGHRSGCWKSYDDQGKLIQEEYHNILEVLKK